MSQLALPFHSAETTRYAVKFFVGQEHEQVDLNDGQAHPWSS